MIRKLIIRFLFVFLIIGILLTCYIYLGTKALEYRNGPGTTAIISRQFENVLSHRSDCYILGNSRSFRGFNPDRLEVKTFNFSGNGESYDLMYYKLKYILDHNGKFKTLILGTDFFQFAFNSIDKSWNYGDYFGDEFSKEYPSENKYISYLTFLMGPLQGLNNTLGSFNSIMMYILKKPVHVNKLKDNGQYLQEQRLSSDNLVERDENRIESQIKYFEKILDLCKKNDIIVYLILLPAQKDELGLYKDKNIRNNFNDFIRKYENKDVKYLDFFDLNIFEDKDWLDVNHFTPEGADKFSLYLNSKLKENSNE